MNVFTRTSLTSETTYQTTVSKNNFKKPSLFTRWLFVLMMFMAGSVSSQTLIDPTGDGGFANGATFAANGWTVENYASSVNTWVVGTGVTNALFSGNSAYISNDGGVSNSYNNTSSNHVYFYRDVTIPAGSTYIPLSFSWIGNGESSYDLIQVFIAPTTVTPVAGLHPGSGTNNIPADITGATQLGFFQLQTTVQSALVTIPSSFAGQTVRIIFMWKSDTSLGSNPSGSIDNISLTASNVYPTTTATANGGLWSSPATWVGGTVPSGVNVVIPAGSIVTVDQLVSVNDLGISGVLQWNATTNTMTITGNLTVNSGGSFHPYTSGSVGQTLNISGNFTNNGYTNSSLSTISFVGSGSTLNGTGVFQGNGSVGLIRLLAFANTGSNSISTSQNIGVTFGLSHTAGSLNTNGKLVIDNTAQVYGQPINQKVANLVVTNMGSLYNATPVVFGTTVIQWTNITGVVGTRYVSGNNVYVCTAAANIGPSAPTHTSGIAQNLLWIGTIGTLGNPFVLTANTVGTQYFYGSNLYTCIAATAVPDANNPPTCTSGTCVSGGTTYLYVGSPAMANVNYDATTQTVRSLSLTNPGTGYSGGPLAVFSVGVAGGTGSGAIASAVYFQQIAGTANSLTQKTTGIVITGGITINSDQGASLATANLQASSGVGALSTSNGGVNYTIVPTIGFAGPTAVNLVTNGGSGYTIAPTITVSSTNLVSGANLTSGNFTITMNQGKIVSIYLNASTTSTYSAPPALTLSSALGGATIDWPAGCWPSATPVIGTNGQLTNFNVTSPGFGYVVAPTVGIGTGSGSVLGGTYTSIATAPTARVALYNLTLNLFSPSTSSTVNADDASIPVNRKMNNLALAGNGNGLNLSSNLTLFGTAPLTLTASLSVPGNILNLGGNNLNFTWNGYAGTTGTVGTSNVYIKNGSMTLTGRGGGTTGSTFNYPFGGTFRLFTGTGTGVADGSTLTRATVTETGAPTGATALGTRAFLVNSNGGGYGINPNVLMNYNAIDALPSAGNAADLYIGQAPALSGPWSPKSLSISGTIGTTGTRTTATVAPGPIVPTGNDYFAWVSVSIDSANVTVQPATCTATSHLVSADITTNSGTITSVTITYNNGTATGPVAMTNTGGNTYQYTIPAASPSNAIVTWSITATTSTGLTKTFVGRSYRDNPLSGSTATASASPNPACPGSAVTLTGSVTKPGSATIGTATTLTGATTQPTAFCNRWPSYRMQIVYTAAELSAAGLAAGNITSMAYNITTLGDGATNSGFTVLIGATSLSALTAFVPTTGFTTVYPSATYTHAVGVNVINFSTPYNWDGTSNIIVDVVHNGANLTNNSVTYYTATAGNTIAYTATNATNSASLSNQRLNTTFTGNAAPAITTYTWNNGTSNIGSGNPFTVNPTSTTTYTFTATTSEGCTITSPGVTVNTLPAPASPFGSNSFQCGTGIPTAGVGTGGQNGTFRWYSAAVGGTPLQVGGSTYGSSISVTTNFYVSEDNGPGTCESSRTLVVANVNPPDGVQLVASNNSPCSNSAITLTASKTSNTNGNIYTYTFSAIPSANSGITGSPTTNPLTVTPTASGTYKYIVTAVDGACTTTDTASVVVKALPVIDSIRANPTAICSGQSSTLSVYSVGIGTGPQTLPSGYPASGATSNADEDLFNVSFGTLNNSSTCATTGGPGSTLNLYSNYTALPAPTVTAGQTVAYSVQVGTCGGNFGNKVGIYIDYNRDGVFQAGEAAFVEAAATTGPRTISGNIVIPSNAVAGVTLLRVIVVETSGAISPTGTYTWGETEDYRVNILGVAPQNPALTYTWDNGAGSGSTVTVSPTTSPSVLYHVTVTDPATTCSKLDSVLLIVNPIPQAPGGTGSEQCGTRIPLASVSSNSGATTPVFKWYTVSTGGTAVQTDPSPTYLSPVGVTTTFYVSEISSSGCEGLRTSVLVTVEEADPITVTSSTGPDACLNETFTVSSSYTPGFNTFTIFSITATPLAGSGITNNPTPLVANSTGSDPYSITPTVAGTYTYTITANDPDKDCFSVNSVTVSVKALPVIDSTRANPATVCAGTPVTLKVYSGVLTTGPQTLPSGYPSSGATSNADEDLFNVSFGTLNNSSTCATTGGPGSTLNLYSNYTAVAAPTVSSGQSVPYSVQVGTCGGNFGNKVGIYIDYNRDGIFQAGEAAFVEAAATTGPRTISGNIVIPSNAVAGVTLLRVIVVETSGAITPTGTYTWGETEDYKINVIGLVTQNPAYTYAWDNGAGSGSTVTVTPSSTTTYTATVTDAFGCSNTGSVLVTVNQLPLQPIANNSTQCGPGVPPASVTTGGSNGTYKWYSAATGGTLLQTGGSTYTTSINATTTFYVSENNGTCESARTAVTATVTTPPNLVITPGGATTFCFNGSVSLNAASGSDPSYVNFAWSAAPTAGSGLSSTTGSTVTASPTAAGTYIYTVMANDGITNGCMNTANITVTVNPLPAIPMPTATPTTICAGGSSQLNAGSFVSGTLVTPTLGGNGSSGNAFNITATNTVTITSISMGIASGTLAEVWYKAGGYGCTSSLTSSAGWTLLTPAGGSAITAAGGTPNQTNIPLTSTVTIPAGQAYGFVVVCNGSNYYTNGTTLCAPWASDANITVGEGIGGAGIGGAFNFTNSPRNFNGRVGYSFGDPSLTFAWTPTTGLSSSTISNPVASPTVTTSYTVTVTKPSTGCTRTSAPVTVTVTPVGSAASASPTGACAGSPIVLNANPTGGGPFTYSWSNGSTVVGTTNPLTVNPTTNTTYTVTVTDACGNQTTSSVLVTVTPAPTASIQPTGPISICSPATQLLTAVTNASSPSYQWRLNGTNISGATGSTYTVSGVGTGTYSVVVTDPSTTCSSAPSAGVVVSINALPGAVTITPASSTICEGSSQVLTASGGSGGGNATANSGTISIPIPDVSSTGISNSLILSSVPAGATIDSVIVQFSITHSFDQDVVVNLEAPNGQIINLVSGVNITGGNSFTNTRVSSDNSNAAFPTSGAPFTATYKADAILSGFQLAPSPAPTTSSFSSLFGTGNGTWNLRAYDDESIGTGTLTNWNIKISYSVPSASFNWSPATGLNTTSGTTVTASPTTTTTYTATATNGAGCTSSAMATVTVNPAITGSGTTTPVTCFGGTNGTATITLSSTTSGTYTVDGGAAQNYTSNPFTVTALGAGNHTIVATSAAGCVSSLIGVTVGGPSAQLSGTATTTPTTCAGAPTGTATITLSGGSGSAPGTYSLDGGGAVAFSSNPFTISGLTAGNHSVVATLTTGGCVSSNITFFVGSPATFTATYVKRNLSSCGGTPDGSITVTPSGGNAPYTYSWTGVTGSGNPATTPYPNPGNVSAITNLNYGYYNVTITDANGCGSVTFTNIHVEFAYSVYVTNNGTVSSSCGNTGSIILYGNAGISPYTYSLDGTTYQASNTFNNLAAGNYTGYIKDAGGCVSSKPITVGAAAPITVSPFARSTTGCSDDGVIEIYRSGGIPPYTYSINGTTYQAGSTFSSLAAGQYTAYVKDSKGCIGSQTVTVGQGSALVVTANKQNTSTCTNDGSIQVNVSGGISPYTYSINGGTYQASNSFSGLAAGNYVMSVKDFKGCLGSLNVTIGLNPIVVSATANAASNCTTSNGKIQLFRTGGVGPYMYSLDGNTYQPSNTFLNVAAGTYSGFVRDSKTCIGVLNGIVVGPSGCPPPPITFNTKNGSVKGSLVTEHAIKVQAYPNPSTSEFTLALEGFNNMQKIVVTVTDVEGRLIYQTEGIGKIQYQFGSRFFAGMYNVNVQQGILSKSLKIVKQ